MQKAKAENATVIDVDGTYLERKRQKLLASNISVEPLPHPIYPPLGWQTVLEQNQKEIALQMPCVLPTTLYTYLAEGVGNAKGALAFRALKRGYVHWASGRVVKLEVHTLHTLYMFVRSTVLPSMRSGTYTVKVMLKKEMCRGHLVANIAEASCECAAG